MYYAGTIVRRLTGHTIINKYSYIKGQSNEIFDPQFFSSFQPVWATDQWVKTVSFLFSFSPRYSYFSGAPRSMILRRVSFFSILKYEYLGENENILIHWSVAQTGSNDENNWRSKISLDCPKCVILLLGYFRNT